VTLNHNWLKRFKLMAHKKLNHNFRIIN
jgi:hypothetical protein